MPIKLLAGQSLQIFNGYIDLFVNRVMAISVEELKEIPERNLSLAQRLALEEKNPEVCIEKNRDWSDVQRQEKH